MIIDGVGRRPGFLIFKEVLSKGNGTENTDRDRVKGRGIELLFKKLC